MTWSSFDMVTSVVRGTSAVSFAYGPERARYQRQDISTTGTTTTLYMAGGAVEVITRPGGAVESKHQIGDFAVVTTTASTTATHYLHRDHLGSVDAITDDFGAVVQRLSFDAWGKRREGSNWLAMTDPAIASFGTFTAVTTTRGFTGHEMVDPVGLVHMNGNNWGRFHLSAPIALTGNARACAAILMARLGRDAPPRRGPAPAPVFQSSASPVGYPTSASTLATASRSWAGSGACGGTGSPTA